jgi:hypothetical protein
MKINNLVMAQNHHISPIMAQLINFSYDNSYDRQSKIFYLVKNNKNIYNEHGERTCEEVFSKNNYYRLSDEMAKHLNLNDVYYVETSILGKSEQKAKDIFSNIFEIIESGDINLDIKEKYPLIAEYLIYEWLRSNKIRKIIEIELNNIFKEVSNINIKDAHLCFLNSSEKQKYLSYLLNCNSKWFFIKNSLFNKYPFITGDINIIMSNDFLYYPISHKYALYITFTKKLTILSTNFNKIIVQDGGFNWYYIKEQYKENIDYFNNLVYVNSDEVAGGYEKNFLIKYAYFLENDYKKTYYY